MNDEVVPDVVYGSVLEISDAGGALPLTSHCTADADEVAVTLNVSELPLVIVWFVPGQLVVVLRQETAGPFVGRL